MREQIAQLESEIKNLRDRINRINQRNKEIEDEIHQLTKKQDELSKEVKKKRDELAKTRRDLEDLERYIHEIQETIDNLDYSCSDFKPQMIEHVGRVIVYEAPVVAFEAKLEKEYGDQYSKGSVSSTANKVRFNTIDVQSDPWTQEYGQSFERTESLNNRFLHQADFSCLNNSQLSLGAGTIRSISGRKITADWNGRSTTLDLGSCSKIEVVGRRRTPRVGQRIYWRGRNNGRGYNVFSATCIWFDIIIYLNHASYHE